MSVSVDVRDEVVVYQATDQLGCVLYIGQTNDIERRVREHQRLSVWWKFVVRIDLVRRCSSRAEAIDAEQFLIKECRPLYNQHHCVSAAAMAPYRLLAEAGLHPVLATIDEACAAILGPITRRTEEAPV